MARSHTSVPERIERRRGNVEHPRVYGPWGYHEDIDIGERYQVKCIVVKPGRHAKQRCGAILLRVDLTGKRPEPYVATIVRRA